MEMLTEGLKREDIYKLITGCVVPRPIAWVSSLNENGTVNLAPFSTFTFVASYPPMLGFNVGRRFWFEDRGRRLGLRQALNELL